MAAVGAVRIIPGSVRADGVILDRQDMPSMSATRISEEAKGIYKRALSDAFKRHGTINQDMLAEMAESLFKAARDRLQSEPAVASEVSILSGMIEKLADHGYDAQVYNPASMAALAIGNSGYKFGTYYSEQMEPEQLRTYVEHESANIAAICEASSELEHLTRMAEHVGSEPVAKLFGEAKDDVGRMQEHLRDMVEKAKYRISVLAESQQQPNALQRK